MLLSHTVLSKLYQEKLVTEDEVKRMKGERVDVIDRLVNDQCTKPAEDVTKTGDILDQFGHAESAGRLRGW